MTAGLVIAAALSASPAADGASAARCHPLTLGPDRRPVVTVELEGYGPAPFYIDTGASHTALSARIAARIGAELSEDTHVVTLTQPFETRLASVRLSLEDDAPRLVDAVLVDASLDAEAHAIGLLGANYFAGTRARFDFAGGLLCLDADAPRPDGARHRTSNVLAGQASARFLEPFHVLVDTGATQTVINGPLARQAGARRMPMELTLRGVATRVQRTEETARLHRVRFGGLCARRMDVPAVDLYVFEAMGWGDVPAIVLGMDLLSEASLVVDFRTGRFQIDGAGPLECRDRRPFEG